MNVVMCFLAIKTITYYISSNHSTKRWRYSSAEFSLEVPQTMPTRNALYSSVFSRWRSKANTGQACLLLLLRRERLSTLKETPRASVPNETANHICKAWRRPFSKPKRQCSPFDKRTEGVHFGVLSNCRVLLRRSSMCGFRSPSRLFKSAR